MELVTVQQIKPKKDIWYLVRCPEYSESGWEIAQWVDDEWCHGHMSQSCHEYVTAYNPIPIEDM